MFKKRIVSLFLVLFLIASSSVRSIIAGSEISGNEKGKAVVALALFGGACWFLWKGFKFSNKTKVEKFPNGNPKKIEMFTGMDLNAKNLALGLGCLVLFLAISKNKKEKEIKIV